jgi:quercetin dioxygenase-like cupin family protein
MKYNRFLLSLLLVTGASGGNGCAHSHRILADDNASIYSQELAAALAMHPIGPRENIRICLVRQSERSSVHLVQVRKGEKPHIHEAHDMSVFVLRGYGEMTIGHETKTIREGDVAHVSAGVRHYFTNRCTSPAVAVVIFSPPFDGKDTKPVE